MSRLTTRKNELEGNILRMQFYCIDPTLESFNIIDSDKTLKLREGDNFVAWRTAAHALRDPAAIPIFGSLLKSISSRLLLRPTQSLLDQGWYMFFATGSIDILKMVFEVSGNRRAKSDLRDVALEMFTTFRGEYEKKIQEARAGGLPETPAFTVFDEFQKILDQNTQKLEEIENTKGLASAEEIINKMATLARNVPTEGDSDEEPETDEKKKRDARVAKASIIFDQVAKDVLARLG